MSRPGLRRGPSSACRARPSLFFYTAQHAMMWNFHVAALSDNRCLPAGSSQFHPLLKVQDKAIGVWDDWKEQFKRRGC